MPSLPSLKIPGMPALSKWVDQLIGVLNPVLASGTTAIQGIPVPRPTAQNLGQTLVLSQLNGPDQGFSWITPLSPSGLNNASATVIGVTKLTFNPVNPADPIAVGDNDPRNSNARTPTGAAGGSLAGTYPNPSLSNVITGAGPVGNSTTIPVITYGNDGRLTTVTTATISFPPPTSNGMGILVSPGSGGGVRPMRISSGVLPTNASTSWQATTGYLGDCSAGSIVQSGSITNPLVIDAARPMIIFQPSGTSGTAAFACNQGSQGQTPVWGWLPLLQGSVMPLGVNDMRLWFGMSGNASTGIPALLQVDSSNSLGYIAFRWSPTTAGDAHFMACIGNGVTHFELDTGVTPTSGTTQLFCIDAGNFPTSVDFWINTTKVTITSGNITMSGMTGALALPFFGICLDQASGTLSRNVQYGPWVQYVAF